MMNLKMKINNEIFTKTKAAQKAAFLFAVCYNYYLDEKYMY